MLVLHPASWWNYIPFTSAAGITKRETAGGGKHYKFKEEEDDEEKKEAQEEFEALTSFCSLDLDEVTTTKEVYNRISDELLGDVVEIKPFLDGIYD